MQSTATAGSSHRTRFRAATHSARMNRSEPIVSRNVATIGCLNRSALATAATTRPATDNPRAIHWSDDSDPIPIFESQGTRFFSQ